MGGSPEPWHAWVATTSTASAGTPMELEFSLIRVDFTDSGDASVSVHVQPVASAVPFRGMAGITVVFFVLIDAAPGHGTAPARAPDLQAIGNAALAQARQLLHSASLEQHFQRLEAEELRREAQAQIRGLGLPG